MPPSKTTTRSRVAARKSRMGDTVANLDTVVARLIQSNGVADGLQLVEIANEMQADGLEDLEALRRHAECGPCGGSRAGRSRRRCRRRDPSRGRSPLRNPHAPRQC